MLQDHSFEVRKTCNTCEKLSYISLGVLPVVFCDIWQYFVKMCKKNIKKCKTSVKTILHQKGAVAIFFSVSWKNMWYLRFGIHCGFGHLRAGSDANKQLGQLNSTWDILFKIFF